MDTVIYIRWSSAEQSKGSSLERQRDDCRRHAAAKGWRVIEEIIDDGVSAFKGTHTKTGKLGGFMAAVEGGEYPDGVILLTEKLDRLSREEAKKVFIWLVRFTDMGVVVATVDGDRRYDRNNLDMAAIIEVVVKSALANEESEKKSQRLGAAWAAKRARLDAGDRSVMTRRAPGWLSVEDGRFVVIEERAAVVRRIFEQTSEGYGKQHIARNLNLDGIKTFGRASGWHTSYVQKILVSAAVLGEFQPGKKARGDSRTLVGDPIKDYYPAIIDADLHARAWKGMRGNVRGVTGRGRRLVNLLAGLAKCAACGEKMTFRGKGGKVRADGRVVYEDYLICDSYQRGRGCDHGTHWNYQVWEAEILDAVLEDAVGDRHFTVPVEFRGLEIKLAEHVSKRGSAKAKAARALTLWNETERPEAKDLWLSMLAEEDRHKMAIDDMKEQIIDARGATPADEHKRRIAALRGSLQASDETTRFEARVTVMRAVHELVIAMTFSTNPSGVTMETMNEERIHLTMTDHGVEREVWFPPF